jgi:hypothetical protein
MARAKASIDTLSYTSIAIDASETERHELNCRAWTTEMEQSAARRTRIQVAALIIKQPKHRTVQTSTDTHTHKQFHVRTKYLLVSHIDSELNNKKEFI